MGDLLGRVRETVERYRMLERGATVVVAVSGGPDSVALLHLLRRLADPYSLTLHVAHLNHLIRGAEAHAEAEFVAELASSWGVPCTIEEADVPGLVARHGGSVEDAARRSRYAFFERVAAATGASRVALGHQADDVAETVLMNLLRGAGARGLSGIPPVRGGRYIRPLCEVTREEILAYLEERRIPFRVDPSNASPLYLRNRVRHELLPHLERAYAPSVREALRRTAALLRAEDEYLEEQAARLRKELAGEVRTQPGRTTAPPAVVLSCVGLAGAPDALLRRLIRQVWMELAHPGEAPEPAADAPRLSYERVEAVAALARTGRTGARVELPGGVTVRRRYGELVWERRPDGAASGGAAPPSAELRVPGETLIPGTELVIAAGERRLAGEDEAVRLVEEVKIAGPFAAVLDADRVEPPLVVRRRRPGDRFWPLGAPGEKKLKDYLITAKVPAEERENLVLVADREGRRPVWLLGHRPAEPVRVTPGTRRVLHLVASRLEL